MGPFPPCRGGVIQLLIIVDEFSKYCRLYWLDSKYWSILWQNALEVNNVQVRYPSVYFPQGNSTEQVNREIGRLLIIFCTEKHTVWTFVFRSKVEHWINNVIHESTGICPNYIQFRRIEANNPKKNPSLEKVWALAAATLNTPALKRKLRHDFNITRISFSVGDAVLVRNHQLLSAGDYTIEKLFSMFTQPCYVSSFYFLLIPILDLVTFH